MFSIKKYLFNLIILIYYIDLKERSIENEAIKSSILLILFQSYFFYATGHETSFTHIKWFSLGKYSIYSL